MGQEKIEFNYIVYLACSLHPLMRRRYYPRLLPLDWVFRWRDQQTRGEVYCFLEPESY
jgi:hypothetical protein